jgi:hypothetical protein
MAADAVWEKAREQLAKQRQLVIEALAKGYEQGATQDNIDLLLKIQAAIDVLDTSSDEEQEEEDEE